MKKNKVINVVSIVVIIIAILAATLEADKPETAVIVGLVQLTKGWTFTAKEEPFYEGVPSGIGGISLVSNTWPRLKCIDFQPVYEESFVDSKKLVSTVIPVDTVCRVKKGTIWVTGTVEIIH